MTNAANDIEIRIIGQMRSGNHAIISWLKNQYPGKSICFLNNIRHGDCNPFDNYAQKELTGFDASMNTEDLKNIDKNVLIISYEDQKFLDAKSKDFFSSVFNDDFEQNRDYYLGKSKDRFDVIVIRDPFNCLASRLTLLRTRGGLGGSTDMELIKNNWKSVARKAIDFEADGKPKQIVINYNKWLIDMAYRERISKILSGRMTVQKPDFSVSYYGGGSSFRDSILPPLTFRDLAMRWKKLFSLRRWLLLRHYLTRIFFSKQKVKVSELLSRWQNLSTDQTYRRIFIDREIIELSEIIFGEISGTRGFVDEVCRDFCHASEKPQNH